MRRTSKAGELAPPRGSLAPIRSEGTLGELLTYLVPDVEAADILRWPPNVFGLVAAALERSGAYSHVLGRTWPPPSGPCEWADWIANVGMAWQESWASGKAVPKPIARWWSTVRRSFPIPLADVVRDAALCRALLQLSAAADEASVGVGANVRDLSDDYTHYADQMLRVPAGATLANKIHPSKLRVLPKLHTPSGGMTMRSLSHHLALYSGGDVTPHWHTFPTLLPRNVNLLLAPWPQRLVPQQFRQAPERPDQASLPEDFGLFAYHPREDAPGVAERLMALLRSAEDIGGRIDGVIMPELALSKAEHAAVREAVLERGPFLLSGVAEPRRNHLVLDAPFMPFKGSKATFSTCVFEQEKHHRWRLDLSQIEQYGLGCTLDPTRQWWEDTDLGKREVHFVPLNDSITLACLICEDLARQEPVAELVRTVGPNLVIALLMDAPQLRERWPARYATVLADDPGSSVLTLTSAGMVDLSRPSRSGRTSRSIALWKDARGGTDEIELASSSDGVLLSLGVDGDVEWAADGRSDGGAAMYVRLTGVHQVRCPPGTREVAPPRSIAART